MKDVLITARRKKKELITLLVCFFLANIANLYAIIAYHTPVSELITSIFYVIIFAIALYIFWCLVRLLGYGLRILFSKKEQNVD